jgi:hypothetical protein
MPMFGEASADVSACDVGGAAAESLLGIVRNVAIRVADTTATPTSATNGPRILCGRTLTRTTLIPPHRSATNATSNTVPTRESGLAKKIHRMLERVTRIELAWPAWKVAVTARTSAISDGGVCSGDTVNDRTQS